MVKDSRVKMVTNSYVENIAASLVREYLSRKGCKGTLERMDAELPRTEESIGNRSQLAKEAHIEKIMRKNKDAAKPFRAMIEVIVKFLIERTMSNKEGDSSIPEQKSSTEDVGKPEKRHSRPSSARRKDSSDNRRKKDDTDSGIVPTQELGGLPQQDLGSLRREPTTVVTIKDRPSVRRPETPEQTPQDSKPTVSSDKVKSSSSSLSKRELEQSSRSKRPGSASRNRGLAGPITSSLEPSDRRRSQKSSHASVSSSLSSPNMTTPHLDAGLNSSGLDLSPSKKKMTSSSSRSMLKSFGFDISPENTSDNLGPNTPASGAKTVGSSDQKVNGDGLTSSSKDGRLPRHRRSFDEALDDTEKNGRPGSRNAHQKDKKSSVSSVGSQKKTSKEVSSLGDLEMGDVDDLEEDLRDIQLGSYTPSTRKPIDSRPITLQLAIQLKTLLFGSSTGCFNDEWRLQGFGFNSISDISYGIVQHKGGPCGVLASIQACMLQRLLFPEGNIQMTAANLKQLTLKRRTDSLVQAICDIVWRAGQKQSAAIALPTPKAHFPGGGRYKTDGVTETINLNLFKTRSELQEFVQANIGTFLDSRGPGCILLLYSALFSRTLDMVIEDMDDPGTKFLGAHGYCTQEMVNLILTGKAVSNVFNDVVELGSGKEMTRLKGLSGRSDIGLLSLFEHYKSCQVGTYYKTPRFPIWVVCSESHFSVFFSIKKELVSDWRAERRFDLYYYDGLANQQEEIRLTIDTCQPCLTSDSEDLVPPLEHCIRTKWPEASVDWNGSEPIL
ncbi:probable ubiquitin carboxyl-terminal hydrolase MINDY-4 [Diadema antillarum]|uniref:probable ubiquitin carboxyl-terminal hydrolase MINDY-4 n=1 Tax=Diadema antillarum TaxID=105358 RepID=UPI003A849AE6